MKNQLAVGVWCGVCVRVCEGMCVVCMCELV